MASNEEDINKQLELAFVLLEKGKVETKLVSKNLVLVLGGTGAGKSTFTQWVSGDGSKLTAVQVAHGEFLIQDDGKIGKTTINAETIFPDHMTDPVHGASFYDCPGFEDTRSTAYNLATTYLIKKVADYASSMKLILVINFSSVRHGLDRLDFLRLMKNVTNLVKHIDKFENSMALVVTKVDYITVLKEGKLTALDDESTIQNVAEFLKSVKKEIKENLSYVDCPERKYLENATKIIDILLTKDGEKFVRIGLFRRPLKSGPLTEDIFRQEKNIIEKIIFENLNFTETTSEDFGCSLSEKTKVSIYQIVDKINEILWINLKSVAMKIQNYFSDLEKNIYKTIQSFLTGIGKVKINPTEAQQYSLKYTSGPSIILNLVKILEGLENMEEIIQKIDTEVSRIGINVPKEIKSIMLHQVNYLDFLQAFCETKLGTKSWATLFKDVLLFLNESEKKIKKEIKKAAKEVNCKIKNELDEMKKAIRKEYKRKVEFQDIQSLLHKLSGDKEVLFQSLEKIKNINDLREIIENELGIKLPSEQLHLMVVVEEFIHYLKCLRSTELNIESLHWYLTLRDIITFLDELEIWYGFLLNLYSKLSDYKIQKEKHLYDVQDIKNWGKPGIPNGIKITIENFESFLRKIPVEKFESIKSIPLSDMRIQEVNQVLDTTLKKNFKMSFTQTSIMIQGSHISLKNIFCNENNLYVSPEDERNLTHYLESEDLKSITIFASSTIFVDWDIQFVGRKLSVIFIAPKWEIIGNKRIDLSGRKGDAPPTDTDETLYSEPGKPGGAGGIFFGIGETFINGENLSIFADGGKGGPGHRGKDGIDNQDEDSFFYQNTFYRISSVVANNAFASNSTSAVLDGLSLDPTTEAILKAIQKTLPYVIPRVIGNLININVYEGKRGADGGDGGVGGVGGSSGKIILFEMNGSSNICQSSQKGETGEAGLGGAGGKGGRNIIICGNSIEGFRVDTEKRSPAGNKGKDGANEKGLLDTEPAVDFNDSVEIIINYKSYLKENLVDRFENYRINKFLKLLETNEQINKLYDTRSLALELLTLEKQANKLQEKVDFLPFYRSLEKRISCYTLNPRQEENDCEHKKLLNFIYTTVLARINNLLIKPDFYLITDINEHVTVTKEHVEALKESQTAMHTIESIKNYTEIYKKSIDRKIENARLLLENDILPEIDCIEEDIDRKINIIMNENLTLKEQALPKAWFFTQKDNDLQNFLDIHGIITSFKVLGKILSILGSISNKVGPNILKTNTSTETMELDIQATEGHSIQYSSSITSCLQMLISVIKSVKGKTEVNFTEIYQSFQMLLKEIIQETKENERTLNYSFCKTLDIKEVFEDVIERDFNFESLFTLLNNLHQVLVNQKEILKNMDGIENSLSVMIVEKYKTAVKFFANCYDMYNKYRHNKEKLNIIEAAKNKTQLLNKYENKIYFELVSILENIKDDISNIVSNSKEKTLLSLPVMKWKIRGALKDAKFHLRKLTQSLSIEENFIDVIEKFEESMIVLINAYERMETYQEQHNLANFIADVNSVGANEINITSLQLDCDYRRLKVLMNNNLALKQYKMLFFAFKQWAFPFAHHYAEQVRHPFQLELEEDVLNVNKVESEIVKIRAKIHEHKCSIKSHDRDIRFSEFHSSYDSTQPFFVWKNVQHQRMIKELLTGHKIVVKTDISKSPPDKDVIKFGFIDLHFRAKNESTQSEINTVLKRFSVRATHLGNSYFRCREKIYAFPGDNQTIEWSFEKLENGKPIVQNAVYNKLRNGSLMLSPYTMWEFMLVSSTQNGSFDELANYIHEVDLELVGSGSFISKETDLSQLKIDEYYNEFKAE